MVRGHTKRTHMGGLYHTEYGREQAAKRSTTFARKKQRKSGAASGTWNPFG